MKYKSLLLALFIVSFILGIAPYIVWKAPIDKEDVVFLDATLAQKSSVLMKTGK